MPSRTALIPLGLVAALACTVGPSMSASATPAPHEFSSEPPEFIQVHGHRPVGTGFDFNETVNDVYLSSRGDQTGATVRVYEVDTGKTLCEAKNESAPGYIARYHCLVPQAELAWGDTEIAAIATSPDGETSQESRHWDASRNWVDSTMELDSYDEETETVKLSGRSLADQPYGITAKDVSEGAPVQDPVRIHSDTVETDGSWSATITGVAPETRLVFDLDIAGDSRQFVVTPSKEKLPDPTVSVTDEGAWLSARVTGVPGSVIVRDATGANISGRSISAGQTFADVSIPNRHVERTYTVQIMNGGRTSGEVPFTVNAGIGSVAPDAPTVERATTTGNRMTATIGAGAGAVVTVKDDDGTAIAVKVVGASGVSQVAFTMPAGRAASSYSVTQTQAGATSAPTPLEA